MSTSPVMDYEVKRPIGERINFRLIAVVVVFACLVGWPVYAFVKQTRNHGIEKVGTGYKVDLKSLGCFQFDDKTGTMSDIPPEYRDLDGKVVTLEGFMYAGQSATDHVNAFEFVYNIQKCCFGGPPKVQERVFIAVPGDGLPNTADAFRVTGVLHINLQKDEVGLIRKLYTLDIKRADPL